VELALPWNLGVVAASLWLAAKSFVLLRASFRNGDTPPLRVAFRQINLYAVLVMACLALGVLDA